MKKYSIKYGGAITGDQEQSAIIRSIKRSKKTRNWQAGSEAKKFEEELSNYLEVKHSILTSSGSCAGLLALQALELPKGSEVIIPAVTFPTIFNIILQCGLKPVVVDVEERTYNLDLNKVEKAITSKTGAIIAVHVLGNPIDMPRLMKLVESKDIYVIEDTCDAIGSRIGPNYVGAIGDISFTSFHAAHIISMGVGGGVFTNSDELAKKVRMYRDWGRQADINESKNTKYKDLPEDYNPRFIYEKIGYNFQILDLQAAMGRVQLRKINKFKKLRKKNFDYLYVELSKFPLILPDWHPTADVCWFAFPITVKDHSRGELLAYLEKAGIETRPMFAGNIIRHEAYKDSIYNVSGSLNTADMILKDSFWISCHPSLTKKELDYVLETFKKFFNA